MIYLVTAQTQLQLQSDIKVISPEKSLELLTPLTIVGFDTETSGIDPWTKELKSIQLGCYDFQVVIDCTTVNPKLYKEYLESNRLFVGWNLKFDLKFLFRQGIVPRNLYDGFLAEKLMWLGYPAGMHSMSLKSAGMQYLNVELDKSVRGKIIWAGLTNDVVIYSANDVKYLEKIMEAQKVELSKRDLLRAIEYENRFVLPLAYCEYCGVKLDETKWKAKMQKDQTRLESAKKKLNEWLLTNIPNSEYIKVDNQGDLFSGFDLTPRVIINWDSPKQVAPIFRKYGVDITI
jgi:ribonuclease D